MGGEILEPRHRLVLAKCVKAISQKVSVGKQPRQADLAELKKNGVRTFGNLRVAGEDTSLPPAEERALGKKLDLH